MAGDWIKMEMEISDKPEVHYIAGALHLDPDAVVGKLFRVWCWFNKHTTDGNALGVTYSLVDRISGVTGFGEAMSFAGWLEQKDMVLSMPHFDYHTSDSAKKRALTAKRVAKTRNATVTLPALAREEKRREVKALSGKPDFAEQSAQILTFLNEKAGRQYRPVKANLDLITARLKEGFTLEDCKGVVERKCAEWGANPEMAEFLRPETLFGARKFAGYSGQSGNSAPQVDA